MIGNHQDPLRRIFTLVSLWWLCVFGVVPLSIAGISDASPDVDSEKALGSLVEMYMDASSAHLREQILSRIVNHKDANLQAVEEAIRDVPRDEQSPVGAQPRRSIMVRGKKALYALYVPSSYDPAKSYPLIVCLHGAGFTGESYLERWVPRLEDRYILACPTVAMGAWWTRFGEDLVLAILENLSKEYHIDHNRVFLTGMSNGGIGAWIIGMHHADRFAGIAPMASGIDDVLFPFVENLANTPVYVLHGEKDQVMPVQLSRDLVKEMNRLGMTHTYREHSWTHPHAGGHFFPRQELPALIAWFDQQRRLSLPKSISLVRDATHLERMGWAKIDETDRIAAFSENLVDGRDEWIAGKIYARLEAKHVGPNQFSIRATRVRHYTLYFNQDLVDFSQPVVVETNGQPSFKGMLTPRIETLLQEAQHRPHSQVLFSATLSIEVPPAQSLDVQ